VSSAQPGCTNVPLLVDHFN